VRSVALSSPFSMHHGRRLFVLLSACVEAYSGCLSVVGRSTTSEATTDPRVTSNRFDLFSASALARISLQYSVSL
jgi:hypothetical protein